MSIFDITPGRTAFSDLIRGQIKRRGKTLDEFAASCFISRTSLWSYMRDPGTVPVETFIQICTKAGISPAHAINILTKGE